MDASDKDLMYQNVPKSMMYQNVPKSMDFGQIYRLKYMTFFLADGSKTINF